GVGRAHGGVHDEQDGVGQLHSDLGLFGHPQVDPARVDLPAAGVDYGEPATGPLGVVGDPVPGHARDVLDDRLAATQDPVDQARLADVGPADDRDDGAHGLLDLVVGGALRLHEREVLVGELEVLQAGAQRLGHPVGVVAVSGVRDVLGSPGVDPPGPLDLDLVPAGLVATVGRSGGAH